MAPRLSVVMPVHNGLPYLEESIRSIVDQSLDDFEFVILDDGSTDGTAATLRDWQRRDGRLRVVTSARQHGLAGSSNLVVREARAPLIARMDADDVAHRDRLRRQWEVFQAHDDVSLVGTLWEGIDARARRVRPRDRWRLVRRSPFPPFPHGSIMFRRRAFDAIGGYREACVFWEDIDFALRIAATGRILVLPDVLYRYRFHAGNSIQRAQSDRDRVEDAVGVMYRCVADRRAGLDYEPRLSVPGLREPAPLPPAVFVSLGSARLWSGGAPAMLRRLWSRGALAWNRESLGALAWGVCGTLSPTTLRLGLRTLTRARDALASRRLRDGVPHEWRCA